MIVYNFHLLGIASIPDKNNTPLLINSDAVIILIIAFQFFQPVARRHSQIINVKC